jgi:hypothetical protein
MERETTHEGVLSIHRLVFTAVARTYPWTIQTQAAHKSTHSLMHTRACCRVQARLPPGVGAQCLRDQMSSSRICPAGSYHCSRSIACPGTSLPWSLRRPLPVSVLLTTVKSNASLAPLALPTQPSWTNVTGWRGVLGFEGFAASVQTPLNPAHVALGSTAGGGGGGGGFVAFMQHCVHLFPQSGPHAKLQSSCEILRAGTQR